mmetsp:Transcript_11775/g.24702  ORF Transcript_11775/g.24702 Transcript_11775/m.24702 type:complete len:330 (-) Transcript_11775:622-1611(-)
MQQHLCHPRMLLVQLLPLHNGRRQRLGEEEVWAGGDGALVDEAAGVELVEIVQHQLLVRVLLLLRRRCQRQHGAHLQGLLLGIGALLLGQEGLGHLLDGLEHALHRPEAVRLLLVNVRRQRRPRQPRIPGPRALRLRGLRAPPRPHRPGHHLGHRRHVGHRRLCRLGRLGLGLGGPVHEVVEVLLLNHHGQLEAVARVPLVAAVVPALLEELERVRVARHHGAHCFGGAPIGVVVHVGQCQLVGGAAARPRTLQRLLRVLSVISGEPGGAEEEELRYGVALPVLLDAQEELLRLWEPLQRAARFRIAALGLEAPRRAFGGQSHELLELL